MDDTLNLYEAYWMSPEGELIGVAKRHIVTVAEEPHRFGLTEGYLRDVYHCYGEIVPREGDARDEIVLGLLQSGWIRLRYSWAEATWLCQLHDFDEQKKAHVCQFVVKMADEQQGYFDKDTAIKVLDTSGTSSAKFPFSVILNNLG